MKRLSLVFIFFVILASCGYDGKYRYPCQDPENWGSTECGLPVCKVDGACTETLLGWDPSETSVETNPTEETLAP